MSEKNSASATASVGFGWVGLLGVVFVILKLNPGGLLTSPVVDWSWWLVTLPFWAGAAILLGILIFGALGVTLYTLVIEPLHERRERKRRIAAIEARRRHGR